MKVARIISGGQTGADRGARRAARALGISWGGWCPPGRLAEDGPIPPEFALDETPEDRSPRALDLPRSLRTEWNVRDSSATLILSRPGPLDRGTWFSWACAHRYGRPVCVLDPTDDDALEQAKRWLNTVRPRVLNVAGPAESDAPGIGEQGRRFMLALLSG